MTQVKSLEELKRLKEAALEKRKAKVTVGQTHIVVGMGTCGIAAGARETMKAILEVIEEKNLSDVIVTQTGCMGLCEWEPIVEVTSGGSPKVMYGKISAARARQIMQQHVIEGIPVSELVIPA
ncbi:MAG: (2Fe-2S) ferredoxin domain-containing protein [Anaerolineae bacterium]|nr:(2Fe-2S) ferredoxin domain-containing protein [Anaerolineae bacterium]